MLYNKRNPCIATRESPLASTKSPCTATKTHHSPPPKKKRKQADVLESDSKERSGHYRPFWKGDIYAESLMTRRHLSHVENYEISIPNRERNWHRSPNGLVYQTDKTVRLKYRDQEGTGTSWGWRIMQGPNPVGLLYVTGKSLDFILSEMRSDGFKQMSDDLTYLIRFLKNIYLFIHWAFALSHAYWKSQVSVPSLMPQQEMIPSFPGAVLKAYRKKLQPRAFI